MVYDANLKLDVIAFCFYSPPQKKKKKKYIYIYIGGGWGVGVS